ncbi:hypothetical protein U1Q18_051775, partial [Sarracenia purpurea var. burkii]
TMNESCLWTEETDENYQRSMHRLDWSRLIRGWRTAVSAADAQTRSYFAGWTRVLVWARATTTTMAAAASQGVTTDDDGLAFGSGCERRLIASVLS